VPAVRWERRQARLRPEASSACRRRVVVAVLRQDAPVASSAPGLLPRVVVWSLAVLWSMVPSGSAAQAPQRALRAAAWYRAAAPSDAHRAGALVSSALRVRQASQLAQAAPQSGAPVSVYVRAARPLAAAYAQAA
jgi:hypothetical protein